ncbi:hypothetical protein CPC16_005818 [Podila verticillata]|nr:hypothetical protein CPC16_005818 [Podila verticillata]
MPPPPLLPQPSVAPPPVPIPTSNYYQQHAQHTPYQIPIVSPQVANYQQHQNKQQQPYQQQFQYEQGQTEMQRQQDQNRVKEVEPEEEHVLARQIEEKTARLQTLKDQRQASVGSPVPTERYSRGPQAGFTTTAPDNAGSLPPRANPQYIQPVASSGYVDEHAGPRNPQLQS